ncbi:MAG: ABC-2 transporter permease [Longibaculum sp.]
MKGLLIKDFQILKNQMNFLIALVAMAIIFFMTDIMDQTFIISYVSFFSVVLVMSSVSYDEFNNGLSYLMTLPTTKKDYVREKYLFGFLLSGMTWSLTTVLLTIFNLVKDAPFDLYEWMLSCVMILMIVEFMLACILPIQLKFGQNKGNIAMIIVVGGSFVIGYGVITIAKWLHIDLNSFITIIYKLGMFNCMLILAVIVLIALFISYSISYKIMKNKEL